MGESVLVFLSCPLFHLLNLHLLLALQLILRHPFPCIIHFLLPTLLHLHLLLHQLLHPCQLQLPLALSTSDVPEMSGFQSSGLFQIATSSPECLHLLWCDDSDDPLDLIQAGAASAPEPTSYLQSQHRSDAELWQKACDEEMEAHRVNGTWEVVKLPPGKRAIGSRWFLKVKYNADGSLDSYKARLVAKGYSQRPGFDFKETFAPTVCYSTVRIILALAALKDLELRSVDISHAYLNGTLEEEIYMKQPEGFEVGGPDHVCKLITSLYGLKQAGRVWNQTLHSVLSSMGTSSLTMASTFTSGMA
jgi:hypothetical protein